jgi:hypothetical protein
MNRHNIQQLEDGDSVELRMYSLGNRFPALATPHLQTRQSFAGKSKSMLSDRNSNAWLRNRATSCTGSSQAEPRIPSPQELYCKWPPDMFTILQLFKASMVASLHSVWAWFVNLDLQVLHRSTCSAMFVFFGHCACYQIDIGDATLQVV